MRTSTVRVMPGQVTRLILWGVLIYGGLLALMLSGGLYNSIRWTMQGQDLGLGATLLEDGVRLMTTSTVLCWSVVLGALAFLTIPAPRRRTLQEVRIGPDGLELHSEPKLWHRGSRILLHWDDIQVISAQHTIVAERERRVTRHVAREVLDLYLFREVGNLPGFASQAAVSDPPLEGVVAPAHRVRIGGGIGERLSRSVRAVAAAVGAARPDLFYQGVAVDQWYAPPPTSPTAEGPIGSGGRPEGAPEETVTPPNSDSEAGYALPSPLWLDFRPSTRRTLVTLVGPVTLAVVGLAVIFGVNAGDGGMLPALLGIVFTILCVGGAIGTLAAVLGLPVALARCGVRIDAAGLEVVEKRTLFGRGVASSRVAWSDVQAIVARGSAALDERGIRHSRKRPVTDIYLRGDSSFQRPGTGLSLDVTSLTQPTSIYLSSLATFPARRLRFPHSPKAERGSTEQWKAVGDDSSDTYTLSGAQLRAALFAARPDLCHGFDARQPAGT
ncbi:hypothetical protein J4H86_22520 [Spiractinospora alimapuensis]|uniref:hypothetical protein n=1 Tax=Spiractinospora alimapuensis TaxID=2820884 RepID=UPI001F26F595|nr:hypothetical protein [Spiractinospora alimapuensis]QVQ51536.1 hypothetical protein J4H86_22520 [Spiractinospora alimapuensis]